MSQEPEGPWKGSLSSRCLSQVNAWKQAARETQAFKMEGSASRATMATAEGKAASVLHAGLLTLEHSANAEGSLHGGIFCQASGLSMVTFSHGMQPPPHQGVLLVTGDILSFPVCSSSLKRPIVLTKTAHHILLPCLRHLCPVQSLHSLSRFLLQLPTYEAG